MCITTTLFITYTFVHMALIEVYHIHLCAHGSHRKYTAMFLTNPFISSCMLNMSHVLNCIDLVFFRCTRDIN